jgi:hypothetical protein
MTGGAGLDWTSASQVALDRLREAFRQAGFVEERLAAAGSDDVWRLRAAAPDGALAVLVRLWVIGAAVETSVAQSALRPATLDELIAAGLLERVVPDHVRGTVAIKPFRDLVIAADRTPTGSAEPADFVPGVNSVARILAAHTIRSHVRTTLDVGTGNGIQALVAARHSDEVLATDLNPRALAYAALNARMNGVTNLGLVQGSWLEPVADRHFDLIVANPPFVVSPDSASLYRDSGLPTGELGPLLLRESALRLAPGGFAHVTCEWGVAEGQDWAELPAEWTAGTGCDALILCQHRSDPVEHAVGWNRHLARHDPDAFEEAVERWSVHHAAHGYASIVGATIVLRRRTVGRPWVSALELGSRSAPDDGVHLLALFAGEELARSLDTDPRLVLREPLTLADGVRIEQVLTWREKRWRQRPVRLRLPSGLGLDAHVDAGALDLVFALDGRPVEEVVRAVAARSGRDEQTLRALALATLPGLVRRGFVRPASPARHL